MKQFACRLFIAGIIVACSRATAAPTTIVDQEFFAYYTVSYALDYPGDYHAQTFTVRNSGLLANVGMQVHLTGYADYLPPVDDLHVKVLGTTPAGAPALEQVLASATIDWMAVLGVTNEYTEVDVSARNIRVEAGERLAIALTSDQAYYTNTERPRRREYGWNICFGDRRPGGEFFICSPILFGPEPRPVDGIIAPPGGSFDMGFRVRVTVPEPTCALMALFAFLMDPRRKLCQADRRSAGRYVGGE